MPPKSKNPLPTDEIKKLKSALKARAGQDGIDELSKAYSEGTTEKKREILNKYIADRTLTFRFEVSQKTEHSKTESSTTSGRWMTLKQIAQREGMALDDPHRPLVVKDLRMRDHENPALAAENVKQYRVEKQKDEVANAQKEATTFWHGKSEENNSKFFRAASSPAWRRCREGQLDFSHERCQEEHRNCFERGNALDEFVTETSLYNRRCRREDNPQKCAENLTGLH